MSWIIAFAIVAALGVLTFTRTDRYGDSPIGLILAFAITGVVVVSALVGTLTATHSCEVTAHELGYEGKWSIWTECLVNTDSGWFPLDQIRDLEP